MKAIPPSGIERDRALRYIFGLLAKDAVELKRDIAQASAEVRALVWQSHAKTMRELLDNALEAGQIFGAAEEEAS